MKCRKKRYRPFTAIDHQKWDQYDIVDCQLNQNDRRVFDALQEDEITITKFLSIMINDIEEKPPVFCLYVLEHLVID